MKKVPPLPLKLFKWFCKPEFHPDIEGDLLELFDMHVEERGLRTARWLLLADVILLFRPGIIRPLSKDQILKRPNMLQHNFMISWRHLAKNKSYSLLNIGGLAMGMMVAILIGLWIWDELSFNKYHQNQERIAQVLQNQNFNGNIQTWWSQAKQLAPVLRDDYGDHFKYVSMTNSIGGHTLNVKDKTLTRSGFFMEAAGPEMLTLNMLDGSRSGLKDPHSILLSESSAKAFFGNEDPLFQSIKLNNEKELLIAGIYEDLPPNSSYKDVHFIASWELYEKDLPEWLDWGNSWFHTLVQIADNADMAKVSAAIKDAKLKRVDDDARFQPELFLHPMSRWHLYSDFEQGINVGGRIKYVWFYGTIALFVLLLACINFMNLSTARSEKRAKEIGVRKALGSYRRQLIHQFFSESLMIAAFAFVLALLACQLLLPFFNELAGKEMTMLWDHSSFWLISLAFVLITGILAGSYPAIYLSSFQAVNALKGSFQIGRSAAIPRQVLVVVQFTVSVTLIIGTIIVFQQIQYAKDRPVGYNYNNLVTVPVKSKGLHTHFDAFRNDLLQSGVAEEVAKSASPITQTWTTNSGFDWEGKDPGMEDEFVTMRVSHEFGKTVGWQIKEGRDFSREFASDSLGFVINEAAAAYLGFANPVGKRIEWNEGEFYTIIGVVKDMITQSPYRPVRQMIFFIDYDRSDVATIKISPHISTREAIAQIEEAYKKYDPVNPFEYRFADADYAQKFGQEERIGKLAGFFAILAILISCLGLLGMVSYVAEKRTKEIGIRKVLGASVVNLWQMISKEFVGLVLISSVIAIPIAYYFLNSWLDNYTYHVEISGWVFAMAGLGALLITLLTVSFRAINAAMANPIESLRSE